MARGAVAEAGSDTGERILRAALASFAEKGFDGASTREIAARAGVTLGLLQYHFGSKARLWRAAVDRAFAELGDLFREALAGADADDERERIRRLIHAHVRFTSRSPEFARLMHDEGRRRGPRMRWIVDRHVKPVFASLLPVIRRAQKAGTLPADVAPIHFFYILVGAVDTLFHQAEECRRLTGIDPADPAVADAHARAICHLLLGPFTGETVP